MKHPIPLFHAIKMAKRIQEILAPHCERIDIAGSIRRQKEMVGDIEIVCLPKKVQTDLLGFEHKPVQEFYDALSIFKHTGGNIESGSARQLGYLIPTGWTEPEAVKLDLFIPQESDYYRQLCIRTGSADYVRNAIAWRWKKLGWAGTPDGLRLREECTEKSEKDGKSTYKVISSNPTLPPVWASEKEFFEWLWIDYVEPQYRSL